jgi:chromosome transmission fidelity protein 1
MGRKDFHHPFQPYDIQQQFMETLYDCIEQGKVGIFESPTGTGKSLSLICGALTWLREHKRKNFDEALATVEIDDDEPEWMAEHARDVRSREVRQMRTEFEARLAAVREREKRVKERAERMANGEPASKRQRTTGDEVDRDGDEEQFVLADYDSEDDGSKSKDPTYSAETTKLMEKLGLLQKPKTESNNQEDVDELKIYFCSRTHSQLSQFIGELKRVKLPAGLPPETGEEQDKVEELKHLTLGSRRNLCINPKVNKLSTQTAINERCIELQQSSTPADKKCPFLPSKDSEDVVLDFRDHALAKIRDIEDLAKLGSKLQICPYYASRPGIGPSEIVTLPYPLLLQKTARESLGISLKNHIVIIDEAHNLMNAVEGIYSAQINDTQLQRAKDGLILYLQKFRNRLKGSNRTYVAQVVRVIDSLLQFAKSCHSTTNDGDTITPAALLAGKGVDQINLVKLVRYIDESKLARKVEGYINHIAQAEQEGRGKAKRDDAAAVEIPTLMHVQSFLLCLMNPSREGRFLWSREDQKITIQYLLLDPSEHFRQIVEESRAVILAGGTMSPMDDYKQQLFPYLPSLTTFSCGHLIPPENLFVRAITADRDGRIDFTFKSRTETTALRLGAALDRIAAQVRGGMVVFLPSYHYLDTLVRTWTTHGITARLEASRALFLDSRATAAEDTFRLYTAAVRAPRSRGALLLSVVGGKLSEGINFADDLGRCVVVVGLPFPNLDTPAWRAKLRYLRDRAADRGDLAAAATVGVEHAENVCMRSVNQAIGRAIRHQRDWASILLFDARYGDARIYGKLPAWIRGAVREPGRAGGAVDGVVRELGGFFDGKK